MSVQQFEREVLDAHNKYRAMHGAKPLTLNPKLNQLATEWAKYLLARNCMQHRPNSGYGENIYMASGGNLGGADAVRSWGSTIFVVCNYNPPGNYNNMFRENVAPRSR
ncbi:Golgi-associated plant pathogenesis-related protein 1 isoform X2 [Drosophila kikkawai]|uniref:Golgi-associated plant pathogenesis-related protein 1 isoform X2 n=1 Tax=Drosophila kikkawai TaxID=30033 RepID=A0A6P4IEK5_DROKI|nr:Golgi-associated plant pathogenesis-related protein 1 isoform X2 [Drosophila kikkawai]